MTKRPAAEPDVTGSLDPAQAQQPRPTRSPRREPVGPREARAAVAKDGSGDPRPVEAAAGASSSPVTDRQAVLAALLAEQDLDEAELEPLYAAHVTAILVSHDGGRWLPQTLAAIRGQTRAPDLVVAVDTGSTDESVTLLTRAFGSTRLLLLPRRTGYPQALRAALAAAEVPATVRAQRREWLWLLHDDSAPDPDALATLLAFAARVPSAAVLGPKAVDWDHPDTLVDIGLTTDAAGRRMTGLDRGEPDQGQHDQPRDVLAVGTAGALVRREAYDALDGLDGALPLLREDIDLGWRAARAGRRVMVVPAARVRHARATLTGRRRPDAALGRRRLEAPRRLHRLDRAHGLYVTLANGGLFGGLAGLPRMLAGVVVRALALLLTRRPADAFDEVVAGASVALHPFRLMRGRHWRRRQAELPARQVRPLLSRRTARLRDTLAATTDLLAGAGELAGAPPPASDAEGDLPGEDSTLLRRLLLRPVVGLALVLTAVALVAERHLLAAGTLSGGRLLPVAPGAHDLWGSYLASWHPAATGSSSPAAPWLPLLAVWSLPFGGSPPLALTVLLLGAIPLAGVSAWWATRGAGWSTWPRLWGAATYSLLPAATGAVAGGRFDAVVAVIAIPLLARGTVRVIGTDPRTGGWNRAFALGLGLTVATAFSPPVWPLMAVLMLVAVLVLAVSLRFGVLLRLAAAVMALLVPIGLLLPWSGSVLTHPRSLFVGLGVPGGLAGAAPVRWSDLVLLHPGGQDLLPAWTTVPLLLAAAVGLVRVRGRGLAAAALGVALGGYALAVLSAALGTGPGGALPPGWAGVGLAAAGAGLVGAALVAASDGRRALRRASFGLRQPLALALVAAAALVPLAGAGWVVYRGIGGSLHRSQTQALPPFVLDRAAGDVGERVLFLQVSGSGSAQLVRYRLTAPTGVQLGDEELRASPSADLLLAHAVADLTSDRGTDAAEALSTFHVRYVAVAPGSVAALSAALDAQPALSPYAVPGGTQLWQLLAPSARAQVLGPDLAGAARSPAAPAAPLGRGPTLDALAAEPPLALTAGPEGVSAGVPAGPAGRLVVLSDSADPHWRATLDGRRLTPVTAWGWAQAFELPAADGRLRIVHTSDRNTDLITAVSLLGLVLVLAAPGVRRRSEDTGDLGPGPSARAASAGRDREEVPA